MVGTSYLLLISLIHGDDPGYLTPLFCTLRVVPQSPRWLLTKDRKEEAIALLQKAARVNGRVWPPTLQVPPWIEVDYALKSKGPHVDT